MDREANVARRVQRAATITLLLMAMAATLALAIDLSNYIRSIKSAFGLNLALTSVQVIEDENPRAVIHFRVRNDSLLEIEIERYLFELFANGARVGSSYSTYQGTDPSIDPSANREAANVGRTLAPGQALDLGYTLYIYATEMESVRLAQRSSSVSWRADAEFITLLPHAREENVIRLSAGFEE
jgi:hypothetical protein